MEFRDDTLDVMRRYEERFGERVPFGMLLPPIEEVYVPILRQCLKEGSTDPILRRLPPGADS